MSEAEAPIVVNAHEVDEIASFAGDHWGHAYKVLTPSMRARGGKLGVSLNRLPPGRVASPFHAHTREDEVFYVLSGRGVLRYGDALHALREGDCVSCPAGTGLAHQIANPYDEDLVYLAVGDHDPHEVCVYPDSGKVLVRSLRRVGRLEGAPYMEGEPERPKVLDLLDRDAPG